VQRKVEQGQDGFHRRVVADTRRSQGISPKFCIVQARVDLRRGAGQPKGNAIMTKCDCRKSLIQQRLAEMQLSERDRQLARYALRDAETIVHSVLWVKDRIASFSAVLPKLGFKH
jgi:hypothetical protein